MYCQNCGAEIKTGMKFCPRCGTPCQNARVTSQEKSYKTEKEMFSRSPSSNYQAPKTLLGKEVTEKRSYFSPLVVGFFFPGLGVAFAGNVLIGVLLYGVALISLLTNNPGFFLLLWVIGHLVSILMVYDNNSIWDRFGSRYGYYNDYPHNGGDLSRGKKILLIVIAFFLLLIVMGSYGVSSPNVSIPSSQSTPQDVFDQYFKAYDRGDENKIWSLLSTGAQANTSTNSIHNRLYAQDLSGLEIENYNVVSSDIQDSTSTLSISIHVNYLGFKRTHNKDISLVKENGIWKIDKFVTLP